VTGLGECEPLRDPAVVDFEDEVRPQVIEAGRRTGQRGGKHVGVRADGGGEILAPIVALARGRVPELGERQEPLVLVGSAESGAELLERRAGIVFVKGREAQASEDLVRERAGRVARDRVLAKDPIDLTERGAPDADRRRAAEREDQEGKRERDPCGALRSRGSVPELRHIASVPPRSSREHQASENTSGHRLGNEQPLKPSTGFALGLAPALDPPKQMDRAA